MPASRPQLEVLAAAVCFGTTGTAQALGPGGTTPVGVGAVRIVVGAAGLWLVVRALAPGAARAGAERLPAWLPWLAGLGVAAYQLAFFAAVARTGVAVGTVVAIGTGPAAAGLLGRAVGGEPLTRAWAAATLLAGAGVVLLGLGSAGDAALDPLGVGLAVGAGVGYASYTVTAKRMLRAGRAPERVMAEAFGAGAVLLVPALLIAGVGWVATPGGAALGLYLGVVPTALAYVLFARGLRVLGAGETATLTLAEPVTATLLGAVVLGERPGAVGLAGIALVLCGLAVLALPGRATPTLVAAEGQG